jgi:hypothetical protein
LPDCRRRCCSSYTSYTLSQGAFVEHINAVLSHDAFLKENGYLPIDREGDALYKALGDGILLWCVWGRYTPAAVTAAAIMWPCPLRLRF